MEDDGDGTDSIVTDLGDDQVATPGDQVVTDDGLEVVEELIGRRGEVRMSNPNSYQTDQYVEWNWGNGKGKGQVKERFEREVTRTLQGSEVTKDGDEDNPAYLIKQEDGDEVLKRGSELRRRTDARAIQSPQRAAGAALSAKRGETKVSELQGASKQMYDSMSEDELEDYASTDLDGLPEHVDDDD